MKEIKINVENKGLTLLKNMNYSDVLFMRFSSFHMHDGQNQDNILTGANHIKLVSIPGSGGIPSQSHSEAFF